MLNEHFELPPEVELECIRLAEYIASFLLPTFKSNIENTARKDNLSIVKYNEYFRLASKYKNNKKYFTIEKDNTPIKWGNSDFLIQSKSKLLPKVYVKFSRGYSAAVDAYVDEEGTIIYLLIDLMYFSRAFKKYTEWLKDVIKHETRHITQLSGNVIKGTPKNKSKSKYLDIYGRNKQGYITTHPMRDIEFKPNVHSWTYIIKNHLNRNYTRPDWKSGFRDLLSGKDTFPKMGDVRILLSLLDEVKQANRERWKLYIKEIYNLIFK